jgi:hypothetical protein
MGASHFLQSAPLLARQVLANQERKSMAQESPAEKMHNRILNGTAYSTQGVTAEEFEAVVRRSGTMELPEIKRALNVLRALGTPKTKV